MGSKVGNNSYDYSFKILLIGDSGVGKSSILLSLISNSVHDPSPTIGIFFPPHLGSYMLWNKTFFIKYWSLMSNLCLYVCMYVCMHVCGICMRTCIWILCLHISCQVGMPWLWRLLVVLIKEKSALSYFSVFWGVNREEISSGSLFYMMLMGNLSEWLVISLIRTFKIMTQ